jgi:glutamate racemase
MADPKAINKMDPFAGKDDISLLITDSGLGGLAVCADIVQNLNLYRSFKNVKLTYFNAWPEQNRGYNRLPDMTERIRVFNRALIGMERFKPDLIMIACNTLSTMYPRTEFSRRAAMPVIDIIDFGVAMIYQELVSQPDSQVIILGTPTTIEANTHKTGLTAKGISAERVILQACDKLAGEIERNPESGTVREMIDRYVSQAALKAGDRKRPVLAAFCCTHYGYSHVIFKEKLERTFAGPVTILSPNKAMGNCLFPDGRQGMHDVRVDLEVVSRIILSDEKIASISKILGAISPETADALKHYRHDPELFAF